MTPIEPLIAAILALTFHMPEDHARLHVEAAVAAATERHLDPALLLAMGFIESRYDELAVSRMECLPNGGCKRVTTPWASTEKPPHARPTFYCGPMQTGGNITWEDCQRMRSDVTYGYATGATEITTWMNDPHCHNLPGEARLSCALTGYGNGYFGIEHGSTSYAQRVLWTMAHIKKFAEIVERRAAKS